MAGSMLRLVTPLQLIAFVGTVPHRQGIRVRPVVHRNHLPYSAQTRVGLIRAMRTTWRVETGRAHLKTICGTLTVAHLPALGYAP